MGLEYVLWHSWFVVRFKWIPVRYQRPCYQPELRVRDGGGFKRRTGIENSK
jgi:hypothetical protein